MRLGALIWGLALLFFVICAGCSPDQSTSARATGDTVVVYSEQPSVRTEATLERVASWGALDGSEGESFNRISAIGVGGDGTLYVVDTDSGIKRFLPSGEFDGWVARTGEGPREVGFGRALAVSAGGEVAFRDLGNDRLSVFGPSQLRNRRMEGRTLLISEDALLWRTDSLWVGYAPDLQARGGTRGPYFVRLDSNLRPADTVLVTERYVEDCPTRSEPQFRQGFWEDRRSPWIPKVEIAMGTDGSVAFGCPAEFEFDVVRPSGEVLRIGWARPHVEVMPSEISEVSGPILDAGDMPAVKPAYSRIILTPERRIWVWPNQPAERRRLSSDLAAVAGQEEVYQIPENEGVFDVFEPDGHWLGSVRLPAGLEYSGHPTEPSVVIRGDTIWAVYVDEYAVEYVGKFVVRWPEG